MNNKERYLMYAKSISKNIKQRKSINNTGSVLGKLKEYKKENK